MRYGACKLSPTLVKALDSSKYFSTIKKSELIQNMRSFIDGIETRLESYNDIYVRYYRQEISRDEMAEMISKKLKSLTYQELLEVEEMGKMFSETNCELFFYDVAEVIHEEFLKIEGIHND